MNEAGIQNVLGHSRLNQETRIHNCFPKRERILQIQTILLHYNFFGLKFQEFACDL